MCGIVGIWHRNKVTVSEAVLVKMRDLIASRGPDDSGVWKGKDIGFAHRRLSVIDLTSCGHQPMVDEETGAVITYNGEVYNYKAIRKELEKKGVTFKSHTDTEVVLKAYLVWGEDCVKRFNGMFAFAIWDPAKDAVFLSRDRVGIKPLYYYANDKTFLFCSRLGPLLTHPECPDDIDYEALGLYFDMGFVPSPWSIIKNVKKLKPGHSLFVSRNSIVETCYWSMNSIEIDESLKTARQEELVEQLDTLINDSVKLRLIADVPVGTFLSGGVDSALITSIMKKQLQAPPKTFTIGFTEREYDESIYSKSVSDYLQTEHHERIMQSDDLLSLLDDNTFYYDEPLADISTLPTMMVSRLARDSVTVCLSGDGADELFSSYHCYLIPFYLRHLYAIPHPLRYVTGKVFSKLSNQKYSIVGEAFSKKDLFSNYLFLRGILGNYNRQSFFTKDTLQMSTLFANRRAEFPNLDDISSFCRLDAGCYMLDDILQKVDVASMSTGLEVRVPMLDHRIIEFSQKLPLTYKIKLGTSKWIMKKLLSNYLPRSLFHRPKRGFVAPVNKWFRKELKDMLLAELHPQKINQFSCLDSTGIHKIIDDHVKGKRDNYQLLWALLSLLNWNKRWRGAKTF